MDCCDLGIFIFRLLELMLRADASVEFAIEGAAILGSLARGRF